MNSCKSFVRDRLLIYLQKNKDYGNSFDKSIEKFGTIAYQVRAYDKINRFKQLINQDNLVKDETIKDTLLDLINYTIMHEMCQDKLELDFFIKKCKQYVVSDFDEFITDLNKYDLLDEEGVSITKINKEIKDILMTYVKELEWSNG